MLGKLAVIAASVVAAAVLTAGTASASPRPPRPVQTTYGTCARVATTQKPDGRWNYAERCTLFFTLDGPVSYFQVDVIAPRWETESINYQSVGLPISVPGNGGAMGSGNLSVRGSYTFPGGAIARGYKVVGAYGVQVPLNEPRPLLTLIAVRPYR